MKAAPLLGTCCVALCVAGCERAAQDMYDQPRGKAYGASSLFADGSASRTPPAGSVPQSRGDLAGSSSGRLGAAQERRRAAADGSASAPGPITLAQLQWGRERYQVYCMPCHSVAGDGDGRVVRRGFPAPPSYHEPRLRQAPDRYLYDVITHGYGLMAPYADRLSPEDRWAVVAYIRALQLSQHARVDELPPDVRARAQAALAAPAGAASGARP